MDLNPGRWNRILTIHIRQVEAKYKVPSTTEMLAVLKALNVGTALTESVPHSAQPVPQSKQTSPYVLSIDSPGISEST